MFGTRASRSPARWPAAVSRRSLGWSAGVHVAGVAVALTLSTHLLTADPGRTRRQTSTLCFSPPATAKAAFADPAPFDPPRLPDTREALDTTELVEAALLPPPPPPEERLVQPSADADPRLSTGWVNPLAHPDPSEEPVAPPPDTAAARPAPVAAPVAVTSERPTVLQAPVPTYPRVARRMGWEGRVTCRLALTDTGAVRAVTVETSSGHEPLDDAAVAAFREWRFAPATAAGLPVPSDYVHTFTFRLRADTVPHHFYPLSPLGVRRSISD